MLVVAGIGLAIAILVLRRPEFIMLPVYFAAIGAGVKLGGKIGEKLTKLFKKDEPGKTNQ
jgi:hypothetical protein